MIAPVLAALLICWLTLLTADAAKASSLHRHLQAHHAAVATDVTSNQPLTAGFTSLSEVLTGNVTSSKYELVLTLLSANGSNPDSLPTNVALSLYVNVPQLANGTYRLTVPGTNLSGIVNYTTAADAPDSNDVSCANFNLDFLTIPSVNVSGVPAFDCAPFAELPDRCYSALDLLSSYYSSLFELVAASYSTALNSALGSVGDYNDTATDDASP